MSDHRRRPDLSARTGPRSLHQRGFLRRMKRLGGVAFSCLYDGSRFARHSNAVRSASSSEDLDPYLVMGYHSIEKGLALPEPRPGFGRDAIRRLASDVGLVEGRYGETPSTTAARSALAAYAGHPVGAEVAMPSIESPLDPAVGDRPEHGGAISISRDEVASAAAVDFASFVGARHSIRNYRDEPVKLSVIEDAVAMASRTPSVCNRQPVRVHASVEPERVAAILAAQNGNGGFGQVVPAVLVITADLRKFVHAAERYQGWVDGGLFAMTLCYALHSLGMGTCMLNWSATVEQDRQLRRAIPIPSEENIVVLMAVGHMPDALDVAASPRLPVSDLLTVHR